MRGDLIKVRVTKEEKAAAMAKVERVGGLTLSEVVRRLLAGWVKDDPPPENEDT